MRHEAPRFFFGLSDILADDWPEVEKGGEKRRWRGRPHRREYADAESGGSCARGSPFVVDVKRRGEKGRGELMRHCSLTLVSFVKRGSAHCDCDAQIGKGEGRKGNGQPGAWRLTAVSPRLSIASSHMKREKKKRGKSVTAAS